MIMKPLVTMLAATALLAFFAACRTTCPCNSATTTIPDLKGEWDVVSYSHHHAKQGFLENSAPIAKWTILEQQGRHFHGTRTFHRQKLDGKTYQEGFSGVISTDGTRVYIIDHKEDVAFGDLLSDTDMTVYILGKTHADREPRAGYIVLKKLK